MLPVAAAAELAAMTEDYSWKHFVVWLYLPAAWIEVPVVSGFEIAAPSWIDFLGSVVAAASFAAVESFAIAAELVFSKEHMTALAVPHGAAPGLPG